MSSDAVALMTAGLGILVFLTSACRPSTAVARVGASVTVLATVIIYLIWRYGRLGDMPAGGSAEAVWMWSFLLVETACLLSFALLAVLLSRSLERQRTQQPDSGEARLRSLEAAELPRVDVWIATYNEEWAILEKTIIGALAIDWPPELLRIWVLDDGRRDWLRDECAGMGVGYLTRPDNAGRKAGNHNNALATTGAPFILSVDADFVVYPNILYRTLGLFDDPEVAIVQTPQAYFNIDPTRRALDLGQRSPHGYDGIDMFYRTLQPARDAWRSAFYCGTSAVLRRTALEDIGGFVTITDIEDQATSVKLLSCGWRVAFLNEVLSNGLAAESGAAYHDQRNRWCRGSLQICYTSFGPFGHGLRPMQRMLFLQEDWVLGSIYPIVFCLAPGVVWLSEWRVFPPIGAWEALGTPLLLFLSIVIYLSWVTKRHWLPLISQAVQLYTAVRLLPTALTTLAKPFGRSLIKILPVTDKGSAATSDGLNRPTAAVLGGMFVFLSGGMIWRMTSGQPLAMHAPEIGALLFWTALNLTVLAIAIRACGEPIPDNREPWFATDEPALFQCGDGGIPVKIEALSMTGALIRGPNLEEPGASCKLAIVGFDRSIGARVHKHLEDGAIWLEFDVLPVAIKHSLIRKLFVAADPAPDSETPAWPIFLTLARRVFYS